ncbi:MAG: hypothetical protein IK077_16515 [Thermoguttaceae bacterium]|nr:hypothetical protein [Thermoguttaceae bacterium]
MERKQEEFLGVAQQIIGAFGALESVSEKKGIVKRTGDAAAVDYFLSMLDNAETSENCNLYGEFQDKGEKYESWGDRITKFSKTFNITIKDKNTPERTKRLKFSLEYRDVRSARNDQTTAQRQSLDFESFLTNLARTCIEVFDDEQ